MKRERKNICDDNTFTCVNREIKGIYMKEKEGGESEKEREQSRTRV